MSCSICSRASHLRLPVYCPTCARNQLYQLRIEGTRVLLEKEALGKRIETAVVYDSGYDQLPSHQQPSDTDSDLSPRWALRTISSRYAESLARRESLAHQIEALRTEVQAQQAGILQRKELLARRRSDAESAKYQLSEREAGSLASVKNTSKRVEHVWHNLHSKTAESRIYLCRELANLYGLRKITKRSQDREIYVLGGGYIVDLREMNGIPPEHISTSLSNIAHLLMIVSHYLSLRLPAEITLPHRDHPAPTVYTPSASYRSRNTQSGFDYQSSSSPEASRTMDPRVHTPRPRPLFIRKSLPKLAKEDSATYSLFLEGASLLAWNTAWLCRTQGIDISSDSWEEVSDIGKNLWQLLVAPPAHPSTLMRAFAGRDPQTPVKAGSNSPRTTIQRTTSFAMLGHYSHGTAHSFLGASEGVDFMRAWKLPAPTKIADKLKSHLLGEMASAEWEVLEEKEWGDAAADRQFVSDPPNSHVPGSQPESKGASADSTTDSRASTPKTVSGSVKSPAKEEAPKSPNHKAKGTKGWTKVGSR